MHPPGNRSVAVIKVVHILAVSSRYMLGGWCGTAVLIGRRVSEGSVCVAAANVRAVQRV